MKRKFLIILLALVLFVSLVGCGVSSVDNSKKKYSIAYEENDMCEISLSETKATYGTEIKVTVKDIAKGYEISKVTANNFLIDNFKFKMPAENVVVKVYLVEIDDSLNPVNYSLTYNANSNCSISLSKASAQKGEDITVTVSNIANGYTLSYIKVNGFIIEGNSFKMPAEDVVIDVVLKDNSQSTPVNKTYSVSVVGSEYGILNIANSSYKAGETVDVEVRCKGSYVLDKILVNGTAIKGKSFIMPAENVVVSAEFKNALPETPWMMAVTPSPTYFEGRAHWYFTYGEKGLEAVVKVEDRFVSLDTYTSDPGYQDNVEVVLSPVSNATGMVTGKTLHILVSCTGKVYLNLANSATSWSGAPQMLPYFTSSVKITTQEEDGYNGYEVRFTISYEAFGLTKETALGQMTASLGMRNMNYYNAGDWGAALGANDFKNCAKHPLILADGGLGERS